MPRCAFLSTDNLEAFYVYDDMLIAPLNKLGWQVDTVSWRNQNINWNQYQVVVVRSTWDYQQHIQPFLQCLQRIEQSTAILENSLAIQLWNIDKIYLKDIAKADVAVIDTLWFEHFDSHAIASAVADKHWQEFIIKPRISANSDFTYRLTFGQLKAHAAQLRREFVDRPFMIQPFIKEIQIEGEYSLFYFNGKYSHSILKSPCNGDFRVQEEHGGQLQAVEPEPTLLKAADKALAAIPGNTLYARIDLIRVDGEFQIMELELIEPSLYFNMDAQSPARFANAFAQRFSHQ